MANSLCNLLAGAAVATQNAIGWRAWISDSSVSAIDNIAGDGPWHRLVTDEVVFDSKADIIDFMADGPHVAIVYDEMLNDHIAEYVWTGTNENGYLDANCANWNSQATANGVYGEIGVTSVAWTNAGLAPCADSKRLYCFEE